MRYCIRNADNKYLTGQLGPKGNRLEWTWNRAYAYTWKNDLPGITRFFNAHFPIPEAGMRIEVYSNDVLPSVS